jgi:Uma2 family endonuclease
MLWMAKQMTPTLLERLDAQEYLTQDSDYPYIRELLDGEIILSGSPKPIHQMTCGKVCVCLMKSTSNGFAMIAPMDVQLGEHDVVQPDLFWASANGMCVELDNRFQGAPDLVIEVLSPSTAKRDKGYKFQLYQRMGVKEYWLMNPDLQLIEVWALQDGRYVLVDVADQDDVFTSPILNQPIEVKALF